MIIVKLILFFSFLVNFALGGMVYLKTNISFNRANLMFSILSWALALWILSVLMIHQFKNTPLMLFWGKMSFVSASIIPSSYLYFSLLFPNRDYSITKIKFALLFLPTLFFVVFSFTPFILKGVSYIDWGLKTIYGPLHPLFSFYLIGYVLLGHFIFLKKYRESKGLERLQIKYFFLGMLLTSVFAVTTNLIFPLLGTSKYSSLGPSFSIIMVGFTTYSILKHRLMDINIVLKKGTTYTLLMALIFVPSFILILLGQKIFFGKINTLFSLVLSGILFLVAILFNKIKPSTERAVEQILFREKYNYRETLGKFSRAMVSILELRSLAKRIVETITQTMGVEKASFFLLNDERGGFELFESKNIKLTSPTLILSKNAPLPHYLQKIGEIIIKEELAKGIHIPELKEVVQQMNDIEAEASIPLISKGHLIGILNLSHKFSKDIYSHEDIELLTTLANQASIAVENARLYEDLKKSKSYIRRADRLASLGTLTAGLAHEIRNPLVAIKTLTQLLPERLDDEEFRNHFLSIASGEVDRISSLLNELLEFARPSDPKLEFEDINSILDGMVLLISTESKKKQIRIIKQYDPELPRIKVDREQIKQVFLNILLNAIEATPENGEIRIKTRSFKKPGGESYVQIEFTDTGCGIPSEYLEEIFNPFFTTKTTGSGLGLSISNQIVQDHRGYIEVESEEKKGSSFYVNLPINQDYPKRRRSDLENQPQKNISIFE